MPFSLTVHRTPLRVPQNNVFLVIRYHVAAPNDLDSVVRILVQLSAYHIEVLPLSSGKSGAVTGEVRQVSFVLPAVGLSLTTRIGCAAPRRSALQYTATRHTTQSRTTVSPRGVPRYLF
jgi:hypothetical protein